MLLYRTLRWVLRRAVNVWFVEIRPEGRLDVPEDGPIVFAANHPNSIMDTVILGTQVPRQIHYMARSGLFRNPLVALVFDRCGVIPLYRKQDVAGGGAGNADAGNTDAGDTDARLARMARGNDAAFAAAFEVLARGDCLGIFPEGRNAPERHVQELRTGTARIALGAAREQDYALEIRIVPVGLNFENRDRFLSRVLVRFGEPLSTADYAQLHQADERQAVRALTEDLQERLRDAAVHIAEDRTVELVDAIVGIYGRDLHDALEATAHARPDLNSEYLDRLRADPHYRPGLEDAFYLKQRIADAIEFHRERDPARVERIRRRVAIYRARVAQLRLRIDFFDRPPESLSRRREAIKLTAYAIGFAPIFAWGFVNNIVPYLLTSMVSRRAPDEAMRAFTGLVAGTLAFGLCYTLQAWGVWALARSPWLVVLYLLSLPPTGLFSIGYPRRIQRYRHRLLVRSALVSRRGVIERVIGARDSIIRELELLREVFMQAESDRQEFARIGPSVVDDADDEAAPRDPPEISVPRVKGVAAVEGGEPDA